MSQISAEDESELQSVEATAKKASRQNLRCIYQLNVQRKYCLIWRRWTRTSIIMNLLSTCGSMWKALWEQLSRRRQRDVTEERDMLLGPVRTPWFMLLQGGLENLESMYGVSIKHSQ